ncbi:MAG: septation ring formation regulator EzrA [Bacilli bacterium]|nr:septation ring formation regulator EzrA [Bacilli bacterium]
MNATLILVGAYVVAIILIIIVLNIMQSINNKNLKSKIEKLEIEKNKIDSTPITPELSKIESYLKNDKLELMYSGWKTRLEDIKGVQIPRISDLLLEAEYSLKQADYKNTMYKIAKLEMEIYKVRTNSQFLLNEIKEITTSEEKNRAIITKLKAKYRTLYQKYNETKNEFGEIAKSVDLQFENISKRFEEFETAIENNDYMEVTNTIQAIDEMLNHMEIIIEEVPVIVIMATNILPKKIAEVEKTYKTMQEKGYPLDYLNVEYNIEEANKKIIDVMDRTKVLNLEDALFELKVLMEYFDTTFDDFEKEKIDKSSYQEQIDKFKNKLSKVNKLVTEVMNQLDELTNLYGLSENEIQALKDINEETIKLNEKYNILISHTGNNTFAFSKLSKEIENLFLQLADLEERLTDNLNTIGNIHDDELRAREQLEEIKLILKEAKTKIREYNLPIIPKKYYVELSEAQAAIKEIIIELNKKPIDIEVLNTRVDTARDLVFKLFTETKEMMKTAMFAEMAIVYGNRYRTEKEELDKHLNYAEELFYQGEYQKSLEISINALNRIENGIYDKLLNLYEN